MEKEKIVQVVGNVKHNGVEYSKGQVLALDPNMEHLIEQGLFRVIDGVETVDEGVAVVESEKSNTPVETAEVVSSQDTWGAQPDPVVNEPKAPVNDETTPDTDKVPSEEETKVVDENVAPGDEKTVDTEETVPSDDKKEDTTTDEETGDNL